MGLAPLHRTSVRIVVRTMSPFRIPLWLHAGVETFAAPAIMAAPFFFGFGPAASVCVSSSALSSWASPFRSLVPIAPSPSLHTQPSTTRSPSSPSPVDWPSVF